MSAHQHAAEAMNRRNFINRTGAGAASLIGSSILTASGWKAAFAASPGRNALTLTTHEYFGDIEEQIDFPDDYEVHEMLMKGHNAPVLSRADIEERFNNPTDTAPLRELAVGKRRAVITFDDLTRPTPVDQILPIIIEELKCGGVKDENILLLASYGTHRMMHRDEARRKVGDGIVGKYAWINHNIHNNNLDVGKTSFGNRITVNNHFMGADIRVAIGGIKTHASAGYGGGAKAVLPGVASLETIAYNHGEIRSPGGKHNPSTGALKVIENEMRHDMEEAAVLAEVDFSVQVVYNGKRQVVDVFPGDIVTAHHKACRMANQHYRTPTFKNADVVVASGYPQNMQAHHAYDWHKRSLRQGGTAVLILQNPQAFSMWHGLSESNRWDHGTMSHWDKIPNKANLIPQAGHIIVFSQYFQQIDRNKFNTQTTQFATSWAGVKTILDKRHPGGASVAVYPYAPIQHEEVDMT
jgi:lactate racemase